jgi:hypothetical protein
MFYRFPAVWDFFCDAATGSVTKRPSFGTALAAARIALRACSYRTVTQSAHCLEFTIGADAKLISRMKTPFSVWKKCQLPSAAHSGVETHPLGI